MNVRSTSLPQASQKAPDIRPVPATAAEENRDPIDSFVDSAWNVVENAADLAPRVLAPAALGLASSIPGPGLLIALMNRDLDQNSNVKPLTKLSNLGLAASQSLGLTVTLVSALEGSRNPILTALSLSCFAIGGVCGTAAAVGYGYGTSE